jgi:ATP-dependent DNA helicase RecQ
MYPIVWRIIIRKQEEREETEEDLDDLQKQGDIRYPKEANIKIIYTALMNHLQIAAGSGEGMSYDFDIAGFAKAFRQNILPVTYAVKALEQEDIISFNEMVFKPSSVLITANRNDIEEFEKIHPETEPLIKGLLRSYEGIFDFPATVYESQLAKFVKKDTVSIKKELKLLNDHGIIAYAPQKDNPQLTLLQNRMYADNYSINMASYHKRKKNFEERVASILHYINNTTSCRSKLIAHYFNAGTNKACGICDNCINEKDLIISKEEFDAIATGITDLVGVKPLPIKVIEEKLKGVKKTKLWKVINFLQSENKLAVTKEGEVFYK